METQWQGMQIRVEAGKINTKDYEQMLTLIILEQPRYNIIYSNNIHNKLLLLLLRAYVDLNGA